jgi:hypothetical protein
MRGPAGPALLVGADLRLRAWRGRRHELCPPPARARGRSPSDPGTCQEDGAARVRAWGTSGSQAS